MKISTILDQIDAGQMALPEFQRGYVWTREQVRRLVHSLYQRHPVGSLLLWVTNTNRVAVRGNGPLAQGSIDLILDGQQRITSLYGIIRGKAPSFFRGNAQAFTGLFYNLDDETFEFYSQQKMKSNPLWVDVTELMANDMNGMDTALERLQQRSLFAMKYVTRLNRLVGIKDVELYGDKITGDNMTVDVVVDIFNAVNSGGTKLSKGDLALAKVCAQWPEARIEMEKRLAKWRSAGFSFQLDWLLRCINALVTGQALFSAMKDIDTATLQQSLQQTEEIVDTVLNLVSSRLGMDDNSVLGSRYSFPLMARYLSQRKGQPTDHREQGKLLYWYMHSSLWGRYAASTESTLSHDLNTLAAGAGALDELIEHIRQDRGGNLRISAKDFGGWSVSARFYPFLYTLTRVRGARDWWSGIELSKHLLGKDSSLELHHIFPKALLYRHGYSRSEVNAIANLTFQTRAGHAYWISDRKPEDYLEEVEQKFPGAVASHWIPTDRALWKVDRYRDFLAARRELLAQAANEFLDSLVGGIVPQVDITPVLEREAHEVIPGGISGDDEERIIQECNEWVVSQGLAEGERLYQLVDPQTSEVLATLDLAWPNGLQKGLSMPVALIIDEEHEIEDLLNRAGYRYFTDPEALRQHVLREVLVVESMAG